MVLYSQSHKVQSLQFDFFGDSISLQVEVPAIIISENTNYESTIKAYFDGINATAFKPVTEALLAYREQYKLDDWLYYQLIRKTVQQFSPKAENYERYTVYKWFFLIKSGYGATLKTGNGRLLFYIQTNEEIFNLPYYIRNGRQYVCLNYHDYKPTDIDKGIYTELNLAATEDSRAFTYKVTQLPNFKPADYIEKVIGFNYYQNDYHFKVKLNPQIKTIFANYPVVNYDSYFNIPLSKETYQSIIPVLKKNIHGMSVKNGVDYLMRFTRYAFLFETDLKNFGQEKRLTPEQTLLSDQSDCEDRAALFFFLVKEIYDLPMIVLSFPKHVTIAVKFDKPVGKPILYNGIQYSVCEPTPQREDLNIGSMIPELKTSSYEVVYAYSPSNK
jgi:hypothetical protein